MSTYDEKLRNFATKLFEIQAIKFGEYKMKSGLWTPVYCDLRVLVSYPKLLEDLVELMSEKITDISVDLICGVPYTALPIATVLSIKKNYPMVMRRKETKDYGTKKLIEGVFKEGDHCMIVEDVVTSGSSVLETAKDLKDVGITTTTAIVLLNREHGAQEILKANGIKMCAILTMTELMQILADKSLITKETQDKILKYLATSQIDISVIKPTLNVNRLHMKFLDRIPFSSNPVAQELFAIMSQKETNLCVAADLTQSKSILTLAEQVGPHICLFKMHVDIIEDFNQNFIKDLQCIAQKYNFILFEDRKFADIGKTVELQYTKGIYHISSWARVVTAHSVMGKSTLEAIKQSNGSEGNGVFILAQSSTAGVINESYTNDTINMAKEFKDIVTGFVAQTPLFLDCPGYIQLTPGVQLGVNCDNLGQNYKSPDGAVLESGADIAVVGRGITKAQEPGVAAIMYKGLLWEAYKKRTSS